MSTLFWICASLFGAGQWGFTLALPHGGHDHVFQGGLARSWFQPPGSPLHLLFSRDDEVVADNTFAQIGSPEWAQAYPAACPINHTSAQPAWLDALHAASAAGQIPDIPPSTLVKGNPVYPNGLDPTSDEICSATYQCRTDGDIWDAPDGVFGSGFDDGPLPPSDQLHDFLQLHNVPVTHFMIGINILNNPEQFSKAFAHGDDIAVHTYCHPYMTTLSNEDVVAQIGWTMQIIYDSTEGRLPRYWRPPYGDMDARVRAIAKSVFGLETIIWNQNTADWSLGTNGTTLSAIQSNMEHWLTGPKSPGLIILEHELTDESVQAYITAFPMIRANNWTITSVANLASEPDPYQNVDDAGSVIPQSIVFVPQTTTSQTTSALSTESLTSVSPTPASNTDAATVVQPKKAQATQRTASGAIRLSYHNSALAAFLMASVYSWI